MIYKVTLFACRGVQPTRRAPWRLNLFWRYGVQGLARAVSLFACGPRSSQPASGSDARGGARDQAAGAEIGKPAPPFTRSSLTGASVTVPTKHEATVVFFFATWSAPDMKLVSVIQEISLAHPELAVVGVCIDDTADRLLEATTSRGARYPIVWDAGHAVTSAYRISMDPTTLVLDKDGIVRFFHGGFHDGEENEIDDEVSSLLKTNRCGRPLVVDNGRVCFHQCERMERDEAKCTTADCRALCSSATRTCRATCARDNKPRHAALAFCRDKLRTTTREACQAACHTEQMNRAITTCELEAAGQPALLEECTAVCGVGPCRASCGHLK